MIRDIIEIDEDLCNGCGECVPGCHEGALQIVDGKARLISELMCDGLGACVGHCPTGAMTVVKTDAPAYDEVRVMKENIIPAGMNTIRAHLSHLRDHGELDFLAQAMGVLAEAGINLEMEQEMGMKVEAEMELNMGPAEKPGVAVQHGMTPAGGGCPGSAARTLRQSAAPFQSTPDSGGVPASSQLAQWPVQLHLLNPSAPYLRNADLLLAADCSAYAVGDFHQRFLKGKALAIACPKLDQGMESYLEKLTAMIDSAGINTITVLMMEVPCCGGLLQIAQAAVSRARRKVPVKKMVVSIEGELLGEEWV